MPHFYWIFKNKKIIRAETPSLFFSWIYKYIKEINSINIFKFTTKEGRKNRRMKKIKKKLGIHQFTTIYFEKNELINWKNIQTNKKLTYLIKVYYFLKFKNEWMISIFVVAVQIVYSVIV